MRFAQLQPVCLGLPDCGTAGIIFCKLDRQRKDALRICTYGESGIRFEARSGLAYCVGHDRGKLFLELRRPIAPRYLQKNCDPQSREHASQAPIGNRHDNYPSSIILRSLDLTLGQQVRSCSYISLPASRVTFCTGESRFASIVGLPGLRCLTLLWFRARPGNAADSWNRGFSRCPVICAVSNSRCADLGIASYAYQLIVNETAP